jgi:endonuclease/exonuclease/phosphatase family metal-dependent hydrolase
MRLRVLTYNIRHGLGSDGRQDLSQILPVLKESHADIICLQEVDKGLLRSGFANQSAWLGSHLGFQTAYECNFGLPLAGMGNAILSRWPIYSTWNKKLPSAGEPRGLLCVQIDHPEGGKLAIFCTHWGLSEAQRMEQAQVCAGQMNATGMPCVLCGDLNAIPDSTEVMLLMREAELKDAGPADSPTYPADQPESKIDYIFLTQRWAVVESQVLDSGASDHLPLLAELELTG